MTALNHKLGPELRRTLADAVLKITGTLALAQTDSDQADNVLYAAHEAAVTLFQLGRRTPEDLLPVEDDWYERDFRGKQGDRPTTKQLVEHAAKMGAPTRAPHAIATEVYA